MQTLSSTKIQSWLVWFLRGVLILGFLVLFGRLIDLQIIRGRYFKALAEENRIRRIPISAPRGRILARGGEILVDSKEVKMRLIFDETEGVRKEEVKEGDSSELISEWVRNYPMGADFAHLSGYLGEVSEEELGKVTARCQEKGPLRIKNFVGRSGLEEAYDCSLSGYEGEELVEVDAMGRKVRILGKVKPRQGRDLKTTVDYGLQKKIAQSLEGKKGAVVVSDANGEIFGLFSSPSYDPNLFITKDNQNQISDLFQDVNLPLFNRVMGGVYHPGSTFKPIVAIAALEEEKIDKNFTFEDTGVITIKTLYGTFSYTNWFFNQYGGMEGKIGLERAIARSTDTFFYTLGEIIGVEKLGDWAHKFSLDEKTGIDIPGEVAGLVPGPAWKMRTKGERWFLGNTYHMSIGQGDIALTPLGVNAAIATIANGGEYCQPHLVSSSELEDFQPARNASHSDAGGCKNLGVEKENIDLVKEGMRQACSTGGTGFTFFDFKEKTGIDVGCKTGTAETENSDPHAWFVAFAPLEDPQIIATILIENGGEGSRVAGPIAREIFDYWFKVSNEFSNIKE